MNFPGAWLCVCAYALITASDCEGAGEMFRVTTLDAKNPPLTEDGAVDLAQDFFGKAAEPDSIRPP